MQKKSAPKSGQRYCQQTDLLRPNIIASWERYPERMLADANFIGAKAVGLFRVPRDWVPQFLVLTTAFVRLQVGAKSSKRAVENLSRDERGLLERFCDNIARDRALGTLILVRSNASNEDISSRGSFHSFNSPPTLADLVERIDAVLRQSSLHMCVLLQRAIEPAVLGHMSNERRVSANKNRWLIEGGWPQTKVRHRFVRAAREFDAGPLFAETASELSLRLQRVARFLTKTGRGYFHCEWVWNGKRVWVVQADEAGAQRKPGPVANPYLLAPKHRSIRLKPTLKCLLHFRSVHDSKWRKLRRPLQFDRLDLPTADVYLLTGDAIAKSRGSRELAEDLSQLCRLPVVVRCDISEKVNRADVFLPTSKPFTDPDELDAYLEGLQVYFQSREIAGHDWAALLANLVPARASAMVHARPQSPRVQIDALWGFPDGLNHFAHDTSFFYPSDDRLRTNRRFKGRCLLPEESGWQDCDVAPPLDWRLVLSKEEIRLLSEWGLKVADALGHEVQLMVLARIGGLRGPAGCIPWHYSEWEVPPYSESIQFLPPGVRVVASRDDLKRLDADQPRESCRGFLFQPEPTLIRDEEFIREVARAAARFNKPLYFYGSLLGHAYYLMSKTGAIVIPITEGEPVQDRHTYRKLVRDRIPIVVREAGALARVRNVSKTEATRLLAQKLIEESFEVWVASDSALIEELTDIVEVVDALRHQAGISADAFGRKRQEKRALRGGFDQLIFLEETNLRSLKAATFEDAALPLFEDAWNQPASIGRRRSALKAERASNASDLARFSLPLIPPIEHSLIGDALSANIGDFWIQAQYVGNRLNVVVRRRQPVESPNQMLLFPNLEVTTRYGTM